MPTNGQPGIFATLDAGAKRTVGIYFMYDVKQVNPAEWSTPPFDAVIVDKPGFGKVIIGRGAINQKGPEAAFLAALHAFRASGRKLPVNLVLVAEGEEEIASPHFHQIVQAPEVMAALKKADGIIIPTAWQGRNGAVQINLGSKGPMEFQLIASGEQWGQRPQGRHSFVAARPCRQPGLASRAGAEHAGRGRWPYPSHRWLVRQCPPADGARKGADRAERRRQQRG